MDSKPPVFCVSVKQLIRGVLGQYKVLFGGNACQHKWCVGHSLRGVQEVPPRPSGGEGRLPGADVMDGSRETPGDLLS